MKTPVRIGDTGALMIHPETGKYPRASAFRHELLRSLDFASEVWGPHTSWDAIDESHWRNLMRRRLESLVAKKARAVRSTQITLGRVITAAIWLREQQHIAPHAAAWPLKWKRELANYWKELTGSHRDPTPFQPQHAFDDVTRIRAAATFDPRFELLMWFGTERLGQVARARRSDLDLSDGAGEGYGTLNIRSSKPGWTSLIALGAGQRTALDRALSPGGYLEVPERMFQADSREDYALFPSGYAVGRVGRLRGKQTTLSLGMVDFRRNVTTSWIRKNFAVAEKLAGVPHIKGRSTFGVRRGIKNAGGGTRPFADRHFHPIVAQHARKLFLQGNYFHSVFEAAKAYNAEVKKRSHSTKDGSALMLEVLSSDRNGLRLTPCLTETDRSIQDGVKFLSAGLMQAIRNPTAHESALDWPISREDALDILSFLSFLFRQIDKAQRP
jgi:uncharacterized protein (TIGR02391 family)